MYSNALLALAATSLVGQTIAAGPLPQHGHHHLHQKRGTVTDYVTVTDWVTVTVPEGGPRTFYANSRKYRTRPSSSSTTSTTSVTSIAIVPSTTSTTNPAPAPPTSSSAAPTTVTAEVTPTSPAEAAVTVEKILASSSPNTPAPAPSPSSDAQSSQAAPAPVPTPESTGSSGSGGSSGGSGNSGKRGLAYNNPEYLKQFLSSGSKISWAYNWGQRDDSGTSLEFCPMLWGLKLDFADTWPGNAQQAIDSGSRCLFGFNEPDNSGQSNMSPQLAAQKHIELMNPFSGKAKIGSPAITNGGGPNMGIEWLKQWFDACGGKCAVDFVNIHIYGVDTNAFLAHLLNVRDEFQKPVWITEFAFSGSDDEINSQLTTVIDQIEGNSTFSFVERYSYFMVEDGILLKGNSLSTYGNTFAYGA
ncbi:hypothetical protein VTK56DRAFT_3835 [Thermocarpiscus australiensis]